MCAWYEVCVWGRARTMALCWSAKHDYCVTITRLFECECVYKCATPLSFALYEFNWNVLFKFVFNSEHSSTHTPILTQSVCVPTTVAWYMEIHFIFIECITKNLDTFYIRNATVVEAAATAGTSTTSTQKHIETEFQQCDLCDVIQPFSLFLLTLFVCALFGAVHKICFWILFVRFLFFNKFDVSSSPRIRISSWV